MDIHAFARRLEKGHLPPSQEIAQTILSAALVMKERPALLHLSSPCWIVGDVHGQYFDVMQIFDRVGWDLSCPVLFLGDYVDRGGFSLETVLLLSAMKTQFPDNIHLLRGNHETTTVAGTVSMSAKEELKWRCSESAFVQLWEALNVWFESLPIAATVTSQVPPVPSPGHYRRIFCVHGGISPRAATLDDIASVERTRDVPKKGVLTDLLWSDPMAMNSKVIKNDREWEEAKEIDWMPNAKRGCSYFYGWAAVEQFLVKNDLDLIVRAHEAQDVGHAWHLAKKRSGGGELVLTVFSAPNYCGTYGNYGSIVMMKGDGSFHFVRLLPRESPSSYISTVARNVLSEERASRRSSLGGSGEVVSVDSLVVHRGRASTVGAIRRQPAGGLSEKAEKANIVPVIGDGEDEKSSPRINRLKRFALSLKFRAVRLFSSRFKNASIVDMPNERYPSLEDQ